MKNIDLIFNYLKENLEVKYSSLLKQFPKINESTLSRNLKKLLEEKKIIKKEIWKHTSYILCSKEYSLNYLKKDVFERKKVWYNFEFLANYTPNKSSFLLDWYEKIKKEYDFNDNLSTYDYLTNIRWIENLLIDTSFASSKLEWNTYSYLDTEVLIKYNETPEWKTTKETQMILNHKNIIKYILENKNNIQYNKTTFFEIHKLLWENLLFTDYLWIIRNKEVNIWGSAYTPLDNHFQLKEQFEIFLEKLNKINNPFEQSLFILIFIPYFQLFMDINKRTSRVSANIPLIKNWLAPISLLQIKERDYINAILAIYELNDVNLIRELFVNNYLLNYKRYI